MPRIYWQKLDLFNTMGHPTSQRLELVDRQLWPKCLRSDVWDQVAGIALLFFHYVYFTAASVINSMLIRTTRTCALTSSSFRVKVLARTGRTVYRVAGWHKYVYTLRQKTRGHLLLPVPGSTAQPRHRRNRQAIRTELTWLVHRFRERKSAAQHDRFQEVDQREGKILPGSRWLLDFVNIKWVDVSANIAVELSGYLCPDHLRLQASNSFFLMSSFAVSDYVMTIRHSGILLKHPAFITKFSF